MTAGQSLLLCLLVGFYMTVYVCIHTYLDPCPYQVADTIVGDEKTRGISGGERKRLSIACQLFGTPSLIFCEVPLCLVLSFPLIHPCGCFQPLGEVDRKRSR